jgi:thiol-disulfide isomerase/thioredoxin
MSRAVSLSPEVRRRLALAWRIVSWGIIVALVVILWRRVYPSIDLDVVHGAAPDFELLDLEGRPFRLSDHRGQVIVLNFWATWCPPCRAEIPWFIRLQEEWREAGVLFVGVSLDEGGVAEVAPYARDRGINYPVLVDGDVAARRFERVDVLPTTYLIDREGNVRFRHEGLLLAGALRPALRVLARERAPAGPAIP